MSNQSSVDKEKLFRDSVHGYIGVPATICRDFVDTPLFQRLRQIEQTSMRVLYPSAHHDRFIHSLGVYHLGKLAFANLRKNAERRWSEFTNQSILPAVWERYKRTFHLACLLHDCGHSPFSHTLEAQYGPPESLDDELCSSAVDDSFKNDYEYCTPAAHEKTSAILVLTQLRDKIENPPYECDPCLVARMLLGCQHHTHTRPGSMLTTEDKLENCLIQLLNGNTIDVDKLDYILRDTWASGVDNVNIDVERLLSAFTLTEIGNDFPRLAFASQALSVLQSAVDARHYLYQWIYCHHKVLYDAELLKRATLALARKLASDGNPDTFIKAVFSTKTFSEPVVVSGVPWFLPTDGDVACILKQHKDEIVEAEEWLFRQHSRVPLWKTFAEYQDIFENKSDEERMMLRNCRDTILAAFCKRKGYPVDTFISIEAPMKKVAIEKNQLFVEVRGKPIPYSKIFGVKKEAPPPYFVVFGTAKVLSEEVRGECLNFLLEQQ
jgi:HD superfamily phosphohydrolase